MQVPFHTCRSLCRRCVLVWLRAYPVKHTQKRPTCMKRDLCVTHFKVPGHSIMWNTHENIQTYKCGYICVWYAVCMYIFVCVLHVTHMKEDHVYEKRPTCMKRDLCVTHFRVPGHSNMWNTHENIHTYTCVYLCVLRCMYVYIRVCFTCFIHTLEYQGTVTCKTHTHIYIHTHRFTSGRWRISVYMTHTNIYIHTHHTQANGGV